ncbi:MAG: AraC family transcriptional regulator [Aphanocapsa lilacina HA4352-LM1]|jgi:AraC-like DNA-binding protein/quercetin dioxygenase-like cupin family protein|nr:AraC family transcriptional regulator [Aphanocapsa lilacina HA4352-LM1]
MYTTLYPLLGKNSPQGHFDIRFEAQPQLDIPIHVHDFFEIFFFTAGAGTHHIGRRSLAVGPGSLFFLRPYTLHRLQLQPGSRFFVLTFDQPYLQLPNHIDVMDSTGFDFRRYPMMALFLLQKHLEYRLDGAALLLARDLCELLRKEQAQPGLCSQEMMRSYLAIFLVGAYRRHEQTIENILNSGVCTVQGREAITRTFHWIQSGLGGKLTLEDAARQVFLSPTYLARILKRETGKTFLELVSEKRLEKSSEMLLHTALSVHEIARAVGFEDAGYFAKWFRRELGVTPSGYRSQKQG